MRRPVDADRVRAFMRALGLAARSEHTVYLVGGATAVLEGWRESTIDIDVAFPDRAGPDELLRALPRIKDELELNVELASPADFVPVPTGWEDRSPSITQEGSVRFLHYDLYAQALSKLERGHDRDLLDVDAMRSRGLIEPERLRELFAEIEPELYRYPAIDPPSFRRRVEAAAGS
ncbi:MAG TPA: DUF6036 family nucleotidyltransferase [Gaiella sp.]|nr:DUF6036 family nucleotidyltransferase [Gaiella sp.]